MLEPHNGIFLQILDILEIDFAALVILEHPTNMSKPESALD